MTRGLQLSTAEIPISHENIYFKNHNIQISTMTGDSSNPGAYHAKLVNSECVAQSSQGHQGYPLTPNWIPQEETPKTPQPATQHWATFSGLAGKSKHQADV